LEQTLSPISNGPSGEPALTPNSTFPIVVLGGGVSQELFLQDLYRRYGSFMLLDVDRDAPARRWADRFFPTSIYDFEACRSTLAPFVRDHWHIVTFATGPAGEVCRQLCDAFNLPQRSRALAAAANSKITLTNVLAAYGLRVPRQVLIEKDGLTPRDVEQMSFPAVLKPVHGGGGSDVRAVDNPDQALRLCRALKRPFLLQERLVGREELLWLVVRKGHVAALLHGENLFDSTTGWKSPIGLAIERVPVRCGIPPRWRKLAGQLIKAFGLEDDFIVAELIADRSGDTIIDVELNGLSGFACSNVLEGNLLSSLLVDTYLHRDFAGPETAGWVSCMAFFAATDPRALRRMARNATRLDGCIVEPPRSVAKLNCFGATVYKGGYLIVTDARDLGSAAESARRLLKEAAA
jgi:hypothetical protein